MFHKEKINGKLFFSLQKSDLNNLNLYQLTRRNLLYTHIQNLKRKSYALSKYNSYYSMFLYYLYIVSIYKITV